MGMLRYNQIIKRKYIKQTDISKKTEVIPMGQEAELSLISYFGRYVRASSVKKDESMK